MRCRLGRYVAPPSVSISANGRYLLQDGAPWLPNIAAGSWPYIQAVSNTDSSSYFDTKAAEGFNAISISLIYNDQDRLGTTTGNHFGGPDWNNGSPVPPFTTPGNFATFGATYKAHAKERILYALSKGLVPWVTVCYPGYAGAGGDGGTSTSNEGFADEMAADTDAHMTTYGSDVATLFSDVPKMCFVIGGDAALTPSSTNETRSLALMDGFDAVDPNRIWAAHLGGSNTGLFPYERASLAARANKWVQSQYEYSDSAVRAWRRIAAAYAHTPVAPAIVFDSGYEDDPGSSDRTRCRYRTHATMCAGAASMAYARGDGGDGLGWYQVATASWTTTKPGLADHITAYAFWSALPWWTMAPDTGSVYVTAGRGTNADTSDDYINVRASAACLVAHWPPGATNTITVDFSQFSGAGFVTPAGNRKAYWFDPTASISGSNPSLIGTYSTSGTQTFQNSASNNASGTTNDRLLLIY